MPEADAWPLIHAFLSPPPCLAGSTLGLPSPSTSHPTLLPWQAPPSLCFLCAASSRSCLVATNTVLASLGSTAAGPDCLHARMVAQGPDTVRALQEGKC